MSDDSYDREAEGYDNASRYYAAGGIEAYDILVAKLTPDQLIGYNLGTILTYLVRLNWKHDDPAEQRRDAEKAIKYHGRWLLEAIDRRDGTPSPVLDDALKRWMRYTGPATEGPSTETRVRTPWAKHGDSYYCMDCGMKLDTNTYLTVERSWASHTHMCRGTADSPAHADQATPRGDS